MTGVLKENLSQSWIAYLAIAIVIVVNGYFITQDDFMLFGIPVLLITAYVLFLKPAWAIPLIGFFTPLSIRYEVAPLESTFNFPTEPLIFALMTLFLFKLALDWRYDTKILKQALTIAILINLGWILIATLFSTMPVVSWKFLISRSWFVVVFYFLAVEIFKNPVRMKQFLWAFATGLIIVVIYATLNHSAYGFKQEYSGAVVNPLMNDHTEYGAVLGLLIPVIAGFAILGKSLGFSVQQRVIALGFLAILLTGMFYSYSRASWVGLVAASGALFFFYFRFRFWLIAFIIIASTSLLYTYQYEILYTLKKNQEVSDSDFEQHVHSIYNITTDASNTERINRWVAALRMYEEKPVTGFGPGTYMFQYAPYQLSKNMTIISTRVGDQGNAHSEYLGPLAESGLPGMLSFVLILIIAVYLGMSLYYHGKTPFIRSLALIVTLGLITYMTHGFLNNFLDYDKASVPFWSYMAILTSLKLQNDSIDLQGQNFPTSKV